MRAKVVAGRSEKGVGTDERPQLLEHARALGVGDAVEVELGCLEVGDVGDDRVSGGKLVLQIGPRLSAVRETDPGIGEPGGFGRRVRTHVVGERLLEPQIVPPLHRDEVAEPHVRHLVQNRVRPSLVLGFGCRRTEYVRFGERDETGVLHGTEVVFGDENLVVLTERVRIVELVVEEVEATLGDVEDVLGVEILGEGCAAVRAERDSQIASSPGRFDAVVRPGRNRGDVRRYGQRRGERGDCAVGDSRAVGQDRPCRGCCDPQRERGLQIGLLEIREHPSSIGRFVLGVQVDVVVDGVDEAVESFTRPAVPAACTYPNDVVVGESDQLNASSVVIDLRIGAVDGDLVHGRTDEIDPCRRRRRIEFDGRHRLEGVDVRVLGAQEVQIDEILHPVYVARSPASFGSGQIRGAHRTNPR
ncbi:unannotated protein [freshwater metagenome]|uniref:Unannotated protein n=1 Tax=freshwater metagenome TaxID=449393 RepID=A0A6J7I3Z1_9ZZZZ